MNTRFDNLISIYDFRNPEGFIYNSDLVTFTEFGAQLKDLVPDNVVLGATFRKSTDANYGNNDIILQPEITGTVNIQSYKAAFIGGQFPKELNFLLSEEASFADKIPIGSLVFQYHPNFSELPEEAQYIFHWGNNVGEGTVEDPVLKKNLVEIVHSTTGSILYNVYDKAGNMYQARKESFVVEEAVKPHEIKFLWSYYSDEENDPGVKLFFYFDGSLIGNFDFNNEAFNIGDVLSFGFGNSLENGPYPNFYISNLLLEELPSLEDMTPEIYVPRKYLPMTETRFSTVPQKIEPFEKLSIETLKNIEVTTNESTIEENYNDYVGYTFKLGHTEYYFDRTDLTWKKHKFPEDISDLESMLSHKEELITEGAMFKCIPYLRTINGKSTPQITSMEITYDEFVPQCETPLVSLVYGYVKDVLGNPVHNAKILITPSKSSVAYLGNYILPKMTKVVRTGQKGYWDAELVLSNTFNPEVLYNFQVIIRDQIVYQRANLRVSREGTIKFDDLVKENE